MDSLTSTNAWRTVHSHSATPPVVPAGPSPTARTRHVPSPRPDSPDGLDPHSHTDRPDGGAGVTSHSTRHFGASHTDDPSRAATTNVALAEMKQSRIPLTRLSPSTGDSLYELRQRLVYAVERAVLSMESFANLQRMEAILDTGDQLRDTADELRAMLEDLEAVFRDFGASGTGKFAKEQRKGRERRSDDDGMF